MRFPRVRFTVRRMMLAVAAIAAALAIGVEAFRLFRVSDGYRRSAARFAQLAESHLDFAGQWEQLAKDSTSMAEMLRQHRLPADFTEIEEEERSVLESLQEPAKMSPMAKNQLDDLYDRFAKRCESFAQAQHDFAIQLRRKASSYAASKWKYRQAASRPWLPVEPDSPVPD
jgi:hypothetical protein